MAFQLEGIQRLPDCTKGITANEALTVGELILDSGGYATVTGIATATNVTILGIVKVAATGSAVNGAVKVTYTPLPPSQWLKATAATTPTDALMGILCKITAGGLTIDLTGSPLAGIVGFKPCKVVDATNKIVLGYLSST